MRPERPREIWVACRRGRRTRFSPSSHLARTSGEPLLATFQAAAMWRLFPQGTQGIGLRPQPWARFSRPVGPVKKTGTVPPPGGNRYARRPGCIRPNGPEEHSPGMRPEADSLGSQAPAFLRSERPRETLRIGPVARSVPHIALVKLDGDPTSGHPIGLAGRPNGPGDLSPGLRPKADALGQ